jgi:Fibronectin type III domain
VAPTPAITPQTAVAPQVATLAIATAPTVPLNYRVTSVGDGRVSLAWNHPMSGSPSSGYRLSYAPAGGAWRSTSLGVRTSWTLTGLNNGTKYYIYLYAMNSAGSSPAATATAT